VTAKSNLIPAVLLCAFCIIFHCEISAQRIPAAGKSDALEIANWNLEWFGKTAAGFGPDNDALQQKLILEVLSQAGIDIWGFCEIAEAGAFDSMMRKLPEFEAVLAAYQPEQKTGLMFRKDLFSLVGTRLLGTGQKDSFSTRRFPFEVKLVPKQDIGIDTLFLIVVHLKANTGNDSAKMTAYNSRKRSSEWLKMHLSTAMRNRYCMVLGDWNDDLDVSIYNRLPSPFANMQSPGFPFVFISKKFSDAGSGTTTAYTDAVDHQLISAPLQSKYQNDSCFIWRLDRYITDYAHTCSDHYPVYARFNMHASSVRESTEMLRPVIVPNPAQHVLRIAGCPLNTHLQIFDCRGSLLISLSDYAGEDLDVSILSDGVYTVKINSPIKTDTLLFCIQH